MEKLDIYYRIKNRKVEAWADNMQTCEFSSVYEMKKFFKGCKFTRLTKKDYYYSSMEW